MNFETLVRAIIHAAHCRLLIEEIWFMEEDWIRMVVISDNKVLVRSKGKSLEMAAQSLIFQLLMEQKVNKHQLTYTS